MSTSLSSLPTCHHFFRIDCSRYVKRLQSVPIFSYSHITTLVCVWACGCVKAWHRLSVFLTLYVSLWLSECLSLSISLHKTSIHYVHSLCFVVCIICRYIKRIIASFNSRSHHTSNYFAGHAFERRSISYLHESRTNLVHHSYWD